MSSALKVPHWLYSMYHDQDREIVGNVYIQCKRDIDATMIKLCEMGYYQSSTQGTYKQSKMYDNDDDDDSKQHIDNNNQWRGRGRGRRWGTGRGRSNRYHNKEQYFQKQSSQSIYEKNNYRYVKQSDITYAPQNNPNNQQQHNNQGALCTKCGEYGRKTVNIGAWKLHVERKKNKQASSSSDTNVKVGIPLVFGAKVSHNKQSSYYEHDNRSCNVECKDIPYAVICESCDYSKILFDVAAITTSTSNVVMKN